MADQKTIDDIKEFIALNYDPNANGQDYWESGNFDDTFSAGEECGRADTLLEIGKMLGMDLPDKKEMVFE